jgi:hypothetical protein
VCLALWPPLAVCPVVEQAQGCASLDGAGQVGLVLDDGRTSTLPVPVTTPSFRGRFNQVRGG